MIIALPSSGVHSNGFSLVRKVFDVDNNADVLKQTFDELGKHPGRGPAGPHPHLCQARAGC